MKKEMLNKASLLFFDFFCIKDCTFPLEIVKWAVHLTFRKNQKWIAWKDEKTGTGFEGMGSNLYPGGEGVPFMYYFLAYKSHPSTPVHCSVETNGLERVEVRWGSVVLEDYGKCWSDFRPVQWWVINIGSCGYRNQPGIGGPWRQLLVGIWLFPRDNEAFSINFIF